MHILLSGAGGLIGGAAEAAWAKRGDEVWRLVRRDAREGAREVEWRAPEPPTDPARLEGFDAVVHLAGAGIADRPWTSARRRMLRASRVASTAALSEALAARTRKPGVLVCASAVGAYGDAGDRIVDEDAPWGRGFLAELVRDWEAAADPARAAGIRVVHARFGIVLAGQGGALGRMLPAFRLGLGARLGDGKQYMSWVTLDDAVRALTFAMERDVVEGAVNVVAGAVTNAEFTRTLGRALHRPAPFAAPAPLLRLVGGDLAKEALLAGQRVTAKRLPGAGFAFTETDLADAFARVLSGGPQGG
jgi:uncharacterized protein